MEKLLRNKNPATFFKACFRAAILFPFLDSLIQQHETRFSTLLYKFVQSLPLVPSVIVNSLTLLVLTLLVGKAFKNVLTWR